MTESLDALLALFGVVLLVSVVVYAALEIAQRLPIFPIRHLLVRRSLVRLLVSRGVATYDADRLVRDFLESADANPSGFPGVDYVSRDTLDAWLATVLEPIEIHRLRHHAWWSTFEGDTTRALRVVALVAGFFVALGTCYALGLDAWTVSERWRADSWVMAWDSGWAAGQLRAAEQFEELLQDHCKGDGDLKACKERVGELADAARYEVEGDGILNWFQELKVRIEAVGHAELKADAEVARKELLSRASGILASPYRSDVGRWGFRQHLGAWLLALLGSLGAPFWLTLLRILQGARKPLSETTQPATSAKALPEAPPPEEDPAPLGGR